ncbi:MAG: thioesterase family protein [Oscillospiraceae bacterium]|nr:thioesterase family protein [Oscillospiraceae bacterium]
MIEIGMKNKAETVVSDANTAATVGSGALRVFGTPYMIALIESAALTLMQRELPGGKGSVGTRIAVSHDAPTPVGMKVWAEVEVTGVSTSGKIVDFSAVAYDEAGVIGRGTHQRAVIDNERFLAKTNAKTAN